MLIKDIDPFLFVDLRILFLVKLEEVETAPIEDFALLTL